LRQLEFPRQLQAVINEEIEVGRQMAD